MSDIIKSLLNRSSILDTETLGLERGSGIHQAAVYNIGKGTAVEATLSPNIQAVISGSSGQDSVRLASGPFDRVQHLHNVGTWDEAITAKVLMNTQSRHNIAAEMEREYRQAGKAVRVDPNTLTPKNVKWAHTLSEAEKSHRFLFDSIKSGDFHYFPESGGVSSEAARTAKDAVRAKLKPGGLVESTLSKEAAFSKGSPLIKAMDDSVIWVANAGFEGKQIGTLSAANEAAILAQVQESGLSNQILQQRLKDSQGIRGVVAGYNPNSPDLLHITGSEMNRARTQARFTGDWRGVLGPILKSGAGDVRDIMDVVRANQSFAQQSGAMRGKAPHSLSMDLQARIYAASIADSPSAAARALGAKEAHLALHDAVITEKAVLEGSLNQAVAQREVQQGTARGRELLAQAAQGKGHYYQATQYANLMNMVAPDNQEQLFRQQIAKMYNDFSTSGSSWQSTGMERKSRIHVTKGGGTEEILTTRSRGTRISSIDKAMEHIAGRSQYSEIDASKIIQREKAALMESGAVKQISGQLQVTDRKALNRYAASLYEDASVKKQNEVIQRLQQRVLSGGSQEGVTGRLKAKVSELNNAKIKLDSMITPKGLKAAGAVGLGLAALGATKSFLSGPREPDRIPLRAMNYDKWLAQQAAMYGMDNSYMRPNGAGYDIEGLASTGIAKRNRSSQSDFGSPYQGSAVSDSVLSQSNIMRERQKFRNQAVFQNNLASSGFLSDLKFKTRETSSFISSSDISDVSGSRFDGLVNQNLKMLDISKGNWKITATDADTINVKRGGIRGAMSSLFGNNSGYDFRLAGIDAPETSHEGRAAQPHALAAKQMAAAMLENSNDLKLVFDPNNITYGRQVGTVITDGVNMNLDLVRRGGAAFLPFKKKGTEEMYKKNAFRAAEERARGNHTGMWSTPFFQAYSDINSISGKTITFNTLANTKKVAQNTQQMSVAAIMQAAQDNGNYGKDLKTQAAELGDRIKGLEKKSGRTRVNAFAKDLVSDQWKNNHMFHTTVTPFKSHLPQFNSELRGLMSSRNGSTVQKFQHKNISGMDKALAIDSMTSTNPMSRQKYASYDIYNTESNQRKADRLRRMQSMQQAANHQMFNSPIGHHRM